MRSLLGTASLVCLLLAGAAYPQDAAKAPTVRAVVPKSPIPYRQTLSMKEAVHPGESPKPMTRSSIDVVHDLRIRKGEEAGSVLVAYDRARSDAKGDLGSGKFDTKDADPLAEETSTKALDESMGRFYALTFAFMGRREVTVPLRSDGQAGAPKGLEPVRRWLSARRSSQFGPSLLEDTLMRSDLLFAYLGDGPHGSGASWQAELVWIAPVMGPKVVAEVTFRVESVDQDAVHLSFSGEPRLLPEWGEVSAEDRAPGLEPMLRKSLAKTRLERGAFSGKASISRANGLPVKLEWSLEIDRRYDVFGGAYRGKTTLRMQLDRVETE